MYHDPFPVETRNQPYKQPNFSLPLCIYVRPPGIVMPNAICPNIPSNSSPISTLLRQFRLITLLSFPCMSLRLRIRILRHYILKLRPQRFDGAEFVADLPLLALPLSPFSSLEIDTYGDNSLH
jgi:hypothetical protein